MTIEKIEGLELIDFGDANEETKQFAPGTEYPDSVYQRGQYPGWMGLE